MICNLKKGQTVESINRAISWMQMMHSKNDVGLLWVTL